MCKLEKNNIVEKHWETEGKEKNGTEIIIKVANYGKEVILRVEAQGDYQNIKGVARQFIVKLRIGKNLISKQGKNKEYIFISRRYFNHCWKDKDGVFLI